LKMNKRRFGKFCLVILSAIFVMGFGLTGCGVEVETETYNISGEIVDNGKQGIEGVSLHFGNVYETVTTDQDGRWSKSGLEGRVTVTPAKDGWSFTPSNREVDEEDDNVNFTGTEVETDYTLSGKVEDIFGEDLEGVEISFSGGFDSVFTGSDGTWSKSGLGGVVTVTPDKTGWEFDPDDQEVIGARDDVDFTARPFPDGDGTEGNPFLVETAGQLNNVRYYLDKHFQQIEDIDWEDFGGESLDPIGDADGPFTGKYDGNGLKISNLDVSYSNQNMGLFGFLGAGSIVENVKLEDVTVNGYSDSVRVGGLAGENEGTIIGCWATGEISGLGSIGGLVGKNLENGEIKNCFAEASVFGINQIGGLVGANNSGAIIIECFAVGLVTETQGTGANAGGLVGITHGTIINSYATGNVDGNIQVGGLTGFLSGGEIENSYSICKVTGLDEPKGGLIGTRSGGSIMASYWDTDSSEQDESDGGEGRTTLQMQAGTPGDFIKPDGTEDSEENPDNLMYDQWDDTIWVFGTKEEYPRLQWQD